MIKLFKIQGHSLHPLLKDGQRVLCMKSYNFLKLNIDDFVIFEKKGYPTMIKQIKSIDDKGYYVRGTDSYSIDSRDFGSLNQDEIKYKVLFKV